MNIAICDDEPGELDFLHRLVDDHGRRKKVSLSVSCFQSGEELLSFIGQGTVFDLVFLDIFMGEANGVSVARKIREFDKKCLIIFATNSRDHAIEGYGVRALQYLLKPVDARAVSEVLDQAMEILAAQAPKTIQIRTRQDIHTIPLSEIVFVESDARILTLHRRSNSGITFYDRLDNFEKQCRDVRFLRCHKSFLVNLEYVHSIANGSIHLETGEVIAVSINISRTKEIFASFMASRL